MKFFSIVALFFVLMLFWAYTEDATEVREKPNQIKLRVSPKTVSFLYKPFRVDLTMTIKNYDGMLVGFCILWGDGSQSCGDINEESNYWIEKRHCW